MNEKAFISLDTLISIFLLSMIVLITQNTSAGINRGYKIIQEKNQEINSYDNLLYDISIEEVLNHDKTWVDYAYDNLKLKIRKLYEDENLVKIEIKLEKDSYDEEIYEKIIFK